MKVTSTILRYLTLTLLLVWLGSIDAFGQRDSYGGPPINYMTAEVDDPVSRLADRIAAGEAELRYDDEQGYLEAVLSALKIPVSSQTLVFSKTSLQQSRITPRRPRALYFNDDVYVGYCQNGDVLELAATDARQGATFYTLKQDDGSPPEFVRDKGVCLSCHSSSRTQDVPGYLVRSTFPDFYGRPLFGKGTFTTDHTSPLHERWGGWYVTGTHGEMRHMGNRTFDEEDDEDDFDREAGANLDSLEELVPTDRYITGHSDIVALMVLEHQTQMHNALAAANYETRRAIHQSQVMNEALGREPDYLSESSERRISHAADRVLEQLLFCDEFPLTSPVAGTSSYASDFQHRAVRDSKGRSLRDLDLSKRLFRYPCSYMIYSSAFDGLPDEVRTLILSRLRAILQGASGFEKFRHLSASDRRNILAILNETLPEFKKAASAS